MHREKYWRSKIPLSLALLFLLNVFLIVAFELLFVYKYPTAIDEAVLGKYDPAWAGSTILSHDDYGSSLDAYLVKMTDGGHFLITSKPHSVFFGRAKLNSAQPVDLNNTGEQLFYVKNGIHTSEIAIIEGKVVDIRYGYISTAETTSRYLVLAAVMEGLELLVYYFIKKNL